MFNHILQEARVMNKTKPAEVITLDCIAKQVCKLFGIELSDLLSKSRKLIMVN